uniref:Junctional adhesion molecule 3 n=1 Tax=Naja naja TaxID=35670 RepID=A0A8C6XIE3_NAJNA
GLIYLWWQIVGVSVWGGCFAGARLLPEKTSWNWRFALEAELSCIIATTKTANPRIEWKKIGSQGTTYVYFDGKVQGEWANRVQLSSRTSLTIYNVTRADKGIYRCEVVAPDDANLVAEINVNLTVHVKPVAPKCRVPSSVPVGKPATLYCQEQEGFPEPTYSWYRNDETLPPNSKASTKFQNSSFTVNPKTGMLVRNGGMSSDIPFPSADDLNIVGIVIGVLVVLVVLSLTTVGICCAYRNGFFLHNKQNGNRYNLIVEFFVTLAHKGPPNHMQEILILVLIPWLSVVAVQS